MQILTPLMSDMLPSWIPVVKVVCASFPSLANLLLFVGKLEAANSSKQSHKAQNPAILRRQPVS